MEERIEYSPSSLKHRLKHTICGCFKNGHHQHHHHPLHHHPFNDSSPSSSTTTTTSPHRHNHTPRLMRSSSGGLRSQRSEDLAHIKDKCRHLISRMGGTPRGYHHHHRKSRSNDFRYDPLSYALNFDEGGGDDDGYFDEYPLRNFSSRLPHSPLSSPPPPTPPPHHPPPPSNDPSTSSPHAVGPPSMEITAAS